MPAPAVARQPAVICRSRQSARADPSAHRTGRADFFLPVRVLSGLFRGEMLAALQQRFAADRRQALPH